MFFTPFFTAVYILQRLVLEKIYVKTSKVFNFSAVYNQERMSDKVQSELKQGFSQFLLQ